MALGAAAHRRQREEGREVRVPESLLRALPALFDAAEIDAAPSEPLFLRDAWLDGIEVMTAREHEGSDRGLYLAAKGGHNRESHNHNDVGQFLVYHDGTPVLIDVGVETYTAKTFSARRYEIWTMQSAYHNLPTVGGVQQAAGREYAARAVEYEADKGYAQLSLDIAGAYPPEAGIVSWRRIARLERGATPAVHIADRFRLSAASEVMLSLMTPRPPQIDLAGGILLPGERTIRIAFPGDALEAASERIPIDDARLLPVWGDHLFRVTLTSRAPVTEGAWDLTITAV